MAKDYKGKLTGAQIDALPGRVSTNEANITTLNGNVGSLSDLETTDKTSIVKALNEVRYQASDKELITVNVSYGDDVTSRATYITVQIDDYEAQQYELTDNTVTFKVIYGLTVKVSFEQINDGKYIKPQTFTTGKNLRTINVTYEYKDPTYGWLMSDGSLAAIGDDFTDEEKASIVGLYCNFIYSTADDGTVTRMSDKNAAFIIPVGYLKNAASIPTSAWSTGNWTSDSTWRIDYVCLTNRGSHSEAMKDYDGDTMTTNAIQEATTNGFTLNSFRYCRNVKFTINNVEAKCFFPAYAQMYLISSNTDNIKSIVYNTFGVYPTSFNSGIWFTASERTDDYAVLIIDGSYNTGTSIDTGGKNGTRKILPLIPSNVINL